MMKRKQKFINESNEKEAYEYLRNIVINQNMVILIYIGHVLANIL